MNRWTALSWVCLAVVTASVAVQAPEAAVELVQPINYTGTAWQEANTASYNVCRAAVATLAMRAGLTPEDMQTPAVAATAARMMDECVVAEGIAI